MLLSAYTPGQNTHKYTTDVLAAGTQAVGTGYTIGGVALTGASFAAAGALTTLTCSSPSWANSTITASYAVFYDDTPATSKPVLCYWDFGGSRSSSATAFTLVISTSGLLTFAGP